jgi:hypothetical protein
MLSLQVQGFGEGNGCASDLQDGCEWCDSGTISKEEMKEAKHYFVCDCPEGLKRVHMVYPYQQEAVWYAYECNLAQHAAKQQRRDVAKR